jgi:hypothetical protein
MEEEASSSTILSIATMSDLFRDTAFGHVVRFVFSNRFLQYLEERDDSLSTPYYPSEKEEGHRNREYEKSRKRTRYGPSRSLGIVEEYKDADVVGWWNSQDSEVRYPCCYPTFTNDVLCRTHEVCWGADGNPQH